VSAESGFTTLPRELLEQGRSCMGGFSRPQFDLLGIDTRPPADCPIKMNRLPKKWWLLVIGQDYPDEAIVKFLALKDKHLTPSRIGIQMRQIVKRKQQKEFAKAARIVGLRT
jgi:hypothetical protein